MKTRFFKYEAINGRGVCPTYLHRWTLLSVFGFKIYLHHFVGDDWALDPHDHPKNFISIGLRGEYFEDTYRVFPNAPEHDSCQRILWRAPWIRRFRANHTHRIQMTERCKSCWTIAIVGRAVSPWGFWYLTPAGSREWYPAANYIAKHGRERKAC